MLYPRGDQPHDAPSPPDMGAGGVYEWEAGLPTAAELTPVSHQLIPRALAAAFRIHVAGDSASSDSPTSHLSFRGGENDYYYEEEEDEEEEEEEETEVAGAPEDGAGRARAGQVGKKQRMVWTAELHRRFIEAVAQLGDKAAVPKAIVRVMNVEGMTREHVASHLQKYRDYLKNTRDTNAAPPGHPTHGFPFGAQPSSDTSNSRGCSSSLSREGGKVID